MGAKKVNKRNGGRKFGMLEMPGENPIAFNRSKFYSRNHLKTMKLIQAASIMTNYHTYMYAYF